MTNVELLKQKVAESGLKDMYIYQKLGISKVTWFNKKAGRTPFKVEEINPLCDILGITSLREKENIFFSRQGKLKRVKVGRAVRFAEPTMERSRNVKRDIETETAL